MATVKDLVHKLGWDAMLSIQAAGVQPSYLSHVFYVDANNPNATDAIDGVHGESWENPYATIAYAIARNNATLDWSPAQGDWHGQNNYILIAPGQYEEELTSVPYACTVIGMGSCIDWPTTQGSVSIYSDSDSVIDVASIVATTFKNIHFECSASAGVGIQADIMNNSAFINCRFHTNVADLTTHLQIGDMTRSTIRGCVFSSGTTHAATAINIGAGSKTTMFGSVIEDCVINAATAGILVDATVTLSGGGTWIRRNCISNPVKGIDLNNSTNNLINVANNTIIASSDAIEGATAALVVGNWVNEAGTADWEADEND
jgi:hypothetical protein